jgi:hypothetical protein
MIMKLIRVTRSSPAILLLASCSELSTELPETTTVQIVSPNAGLIRSADGLFEVEFQLGALSAPAEVTIHTDRSRMVTTWPMSESLPRYEVNVSPCAAARPEFIRARHRVPDGLSWDGRLMLARSSAAATELLLPTSYEDGWVRSNGVIDCVDANNGGSSLRFELATIVNEQCSLPAEVQCAPCAPCEALDAACHQRTDWVCVSGTCRASAAAATESCNQGELDGWSDAPGSGRVFVLDNLQIADQGRGFDVDASCRGPGDCIDHVLWQLGPLGNDQIRQGFLGGETLILLELAGVDDPFTGRDVGLSAKFYQGVDADDPAFPANNFQIPNGSETCCEFKASHESLTDLPPQARSRVPAQIQRGYFASNTPFDLPFVLTLGSAPFPQLRLSHALVTGLVSDSLDQISEGVLGGAFSIGDLARTENVYCRTLNSLCPRQLPESQLIDLFASILQPDIDLDVPPDGLERLDVGANGRVGRCLDGDGSIVPPMGPDAPAWTCALNPRMADGYSIAFTFTAVPATIVGIAD